MTDIFRELKKGVDFDFEHNDAYTVVSQMLVEWCEARGRCFSDLIIKIKVGDYEDIVFESLDSNNYCFVSDYDWWEGENTIQILDIKRLEDVFDDECYNISDDILGKTVQEAMTNIVSLYEKHSGTIIVHGDTDDETIALHFKEGNGYLVSASPLINEVVYKFSISGIGYYLQIELWPTSVNKTFDWNSENHLTNVDNDDEKEAEWSYSDDYGNPVPCHCTNCGCRAHTETGNAGCQTFEDDILSKFCPNCGARMKLKDGDTNG